MCGIFGLFSKQGHSVDISLFVNAVKCLKHRGPDDEGYLLFNTTSRKAVSCAGFDTDTRLLLPMVCGVHGVPFDLALGHRRLSILDLSPAGHQPMQSSNGRYWITFNGEIYNYIELREELKKYGLAFYSTSDTEVLLAAYAYWGEAMLTRLVGMFAFCILDTERRELFLARDFFGIKPLYYYHDPSQFVFSSEIKALLELPGIEHKAHPQTLYGYLRYGITDYLPETMFAGISQLPPAHSLRISLDHPGNAQMKEYWDIQNIQPVSNISFVDAADELRRLFLENIRLHMRSDVPVGACLSGGIDSSSIVTGMHHQFGSNLNLQTFSYISKEPGVDEENWIDLAVLSSQAHAEKVQVRPEELAMDLNRLIEVQGEPFGSTSIYAQYRVFQLAHAAGIKVMEDGQGADEILAGYLPYASARIASLASNLSFFRAIRLLQAATQQGVSRTLLLRRAVGFLIPNSARRVVRRLEGRENFIPWLNTSWFQEKGVVEADPFHKHGSSYLKQDLLQALTRTSLPMLLRYEDRNSMAFSIESRVPFLTPNLVEFLFSLPEEYIIDDNGLTKAVFRKAMQDIVPEGILNRRDKIGFATPEKKLLSAMQPWVKGILESEAAHQIVPIQVQAASREWHAVYSGQKPFGFHIWRILNLIRWATLFDVEF